MTTLTLSQQYAVIGTMPSHTVPRADERLFQALADALRSMPRLSLIACIIQGFADRDLRIDAADAGRVAQALACAEDGPNGVAGLARTGADRLKAPAFA
jgi:hypothetical protein